jgi:hypothetical protein
MGSPDACRRLRVAFLGTQGRLEDSSPPAPTVELEPRRFPLAADEESAGAVSDRLRSFAPDVCIVFEPRSWSPLLLEGLSGVTLGVLVGDGSTEQHPGWLSGLDRVISFGPGAGAEVADLWRTVPAPVSDMFFRDVREPRGRPRAISIGASSRHREHMLLPAKHHHDLLQVLHGVSGAPLAELLESCDVGVHVALTGELGGYGPQVGVHLAAGQLLISEQIVPAHGLETDIDYLRFDTPEGLVWMLDRLASFPEMCRRVQVRGRMKAEQYRASRMFARLAQDLLADVAAFG